MWTENQAGEWYWPLHAERAQDHLRVWFIGSRKADRGDPQRGWHGALVLDGEYLDPTRKGPFPTAEEAKRALFAVASFYLGQIAGSITGQLADPGAVTFCPPLQRLAAAIRSELAERSISDTPDARAWLSFVRGLLP